MGTFANRVGVNGTIEACGEKGHGAPNTPALQTAIGRAMQGIRRRARHGPGTFLSTVYGIITYRILKAMRPKSCKAKGRRLQNLVRDAIIDLTGLSEHDVRSCTMGCGGEDIVLSEAGRIAFPYAVECKNQENLQFWEAMRQCVRNRSHGLRPLLVFTKNRSPVYCALPIPVGGCHPFKVRLESRRLSVWHTITAHGLGAKQGSNEPHSSAGCGAVELCNSSALPGYMGAVVMRWSEFLRHLEAVRPGRSMVETGASAPLHDI